MSGCPLRWECPEIPQLVRETGTDPLSFLNLPGDRDKEAPHWQAMAVSNMDSIPENHPPGNNN